MRKSTAWVLAGLFAAALTVPGIAAAGCAQHTVTADADSVTTKTTATTPMTPAPETKTGG